jgi:UV DNA damage endonuclease
VNRFGYAAQNLTIPATTNRTLRLAGLGNADKVCALVRENIASLRTIVSWNARHGVGLFRIGQSLIPFASHPSFPYDWAAEHGDDLRSIGEQAKALGIRLSMHPGQYIQPGSLTPDVVERSLAELRYGSMLFDLIGSADSVLVLHMGGAYGDRHSTSARFIDVMRQQPDILRYLALENDERIWTVPEIADTADQLGVPVIVDTLHHALNPGRVALEDALDRALPTWQQRGIRPKVHISSQDPVKQAGAHAFGVDRRDLDTLLAMLQGRDVDIMVEAKGKERALIGLGLIADPAGATDG